MFTIETTIFVRNQRVGHGTSGASW